MPVAIDYRTNGQRHADALRAWQDHYDRVYQECGLRAPEPRADDEIITYRRRMNRLLARQCLPENHKYSYHPWNKVDHDYLDAVEPELHPDCPKQRFLPANIPPGELRERSHIVGNLKVTDFYGRDSFVKQMNRAGRRVLSFWAPTDHAGRTLGRVTLKG